ncbi:MAG: hypothetical protein QM791_20795 [Ferruginibacter sp.]
MKVLIALVLFACSLSACNKQIKDSATEKHTPPAETPACILKMIEELKNKPKQNPPAVVYEFTYKDQKVYYITSDCCDQYNFLYDANCNILCAPDGGITGGGDHRCIDFNTTKKDEKLVWKDER